MKHNGSPLASHTSSHNGRRCALFDELALIPDPEWKCATFRRAARGGEKTIRHNFNAEILLRFSQAFVFGEKLLDSAHLLVNMDVLVIGGL